jgi:hypothetical protein
MKGYATEANAVRAAMKFMARFEAEKAAGTEPYRWWTVLAMNGRFVPVVSVGPQGNPGFFLGGPMLIVN